MFFKFVCELLRDGQPCLQEFTTTTKRMVRQRRAHSAAERMVPYVCNYCSGCSFYEQNFRRHMVHSHPALSTHPPLHGGVSILYRPRLSYGICVSEHFLDSLHRNQFSPSKMLFNWRKTFTWRVMQSRRTFTLRICIVPFEFETTGPSIAAAAFASFYSLAMQRVLRVDQCLGF
ncbi:hypothetical protein niasHS_001315 [Heterodera schachtii]|uniref:C2H2-type domain-containing protein n=1 Tax=Heterodera schachtii TaxID=97005 RepID=A0ABD2KII9_HETSC